MIDFTDATKAISKLVSEQVAEQLKIYSSPAYKQRMSQFIYGGRRYYFTDRYLLAYPSLYWKRCNSEEYDHVYGIGIRWNPFFKIGTIRHQNPYWMSKKEVSEYVERYPIIFENSRKNSENEKPDTTTGNNAGTRNASISENE